MSNSYRIRTTPGVDKLLNVTLDQEFEFLEILSLKVLKDQIYTRQCSDYGVVIGRISINNGLGIPNAKVSVFIPLSDEDATNPIISEIYPYKTTDGINDDGYRYNLLPYNASYNGHVPTGTFFDREDVLLNQSLIEVYDKYYKYTTTTNASGDYMIFGIPTGEQTIFVDIDLSDIGEFSVTPRDLINMGLATEAMIDGVNFRASNNLNSLPQLVTLNRNIEIEPLWGEPELCNIGITRTDFDITNEANIRLEPSATFMGSIVSDVDESALKSSCKVKKEMGEMCSLISGPGEIKSIRQTISVDTNGRPILEVYTLENGGRVIDEDGTWVTDVPMNLDYVITNEFGEQVLSPTPGVGVPTKGKYRFKVKWNQAPDMSQDVKRAYYLVPNVREYGWSSSSLTITNPADYFRSYAFSDNWDDYGDTTTTFGQQMIDDAINCVDKFYLMKYNNVYTVSGLFSEYRKGGSKRRFIGIKKITDSSCNSETNKFPTNDAQQVPDFLYTLFIIMMIIFLPVMIGVLYILHVIKIITCVLFPILAAVIWLIGAIIWGIGAIIDAIPGTGQAGQKLKDAAQPFFDAAQAMVNVCLEFKIKMCLLTYPDCENCESKTEIGEPSPPPSNPTIDSLNSGSQSLGNSGIMSKFYDNTSYTCNSPYQIETGNVLAGIGDEKKQGIQSLTTSTDLLSTSLTMNNRLNLFNTKGKYFDSSISPGGGVNQIKVTFQTDINYSATTWHLDNVICLIVSDDYISKFQTGGLITFNDPKLSNDPNLTGSTLNIYSNNAITGSTYGTPTSWSNINTYSRSVEYASPFNTGNISVPYTFTAFTEDTTYAKFPMDNEYFQVIQMKTMADYLLDTTNTLSNSLPERFIKNSAYYIEIDGNNCMISGNTSPETCFSGFNNQHVIFLVRGVDPNTTKTNCQYDLNKLYGYSNFGDNPSLIVNGKFHLNIPIQGKLRNVKHDSPLIISNSYATDAYSGQKLFYDSYQFVPSSTQFIPFNSKMGRYYSMVDEASVSLIPMSTATQVGPNQGIVVKTNNSMTKEWNDPDFNLCDFFNNTTNGGSNNRGYFVGEQIEGGSVLYLDVNISTPPSFVQPNTIYDGLYSKIYPSSLQTSFTLGPSGRQIVMRSDRLPSSSAGESFGSTNFVLFENGNFMAYGVDAAGQVNTYDSGTAIPNFEYEDLAEDYPDNPILESLQCENIVPLGCYTTNDGQVTIEPAGDGCYNNIFGSPIIENGCYVFVRVPLIGLFEDTFYFMQWYKRQTVMYGLCRDVFSHLFTNNWVNGVLYAFPFKNNTFFNNQNQPSAVYCSDTIFYNSTNNNFYYRSSPYSYDNKFVGQEAPDYGKYEGNVRNLMFPTTMMCLGPKQEFLSEVSQTGELDGYMMNKMVPTTYNDVSELLSLFVLIRLTYTLSSASGIGSFFNKRDNQFVDGDYAQLLSINSEIGVYPFEPGYYSGSDIYSYTGFIGNNNTIGIFFKSNLQTRDYVTPRRTIYTGIGPLSTVDCAFEKIETFSQDVPFYQWHIDGPWNEGLSTNNTIFGRQRNNWVSTNFYDNSFFHHKYQDMDRLNGGSRYFRTTNLSQTDYFKSYIYAVDNSGNQNPDENYWLRNVTYGTEYVTVGAPFHFYFGLKQGKSAYDKFAQVWVDFDNITY